MSETTGTAGTLETREDAGKGEAALVSLWLDAISLADREEKHWRERGAEIIRLYRDDGDDDRQVDRARRRKFNILYSNVETTAPAIYNSPPIPDVRRRFRDNDPVGRVASQVLERCLSYSIDRYDLDSKLEAAVKDTLLPGRGVARLRYEPVLGEDGALLSESVSCEPVDWRRFRRGPARFWDDVPWVAFEHFLTREELLRLSPRLGGKVNLDCTVDERKRDDGSPPPEMFKRARVWEIWDKERREVLFIATGYKEAPIFKAEDPLGLSGFFPVPKPLYGIETPGNLVPVAPYNAYQGLAEDLEEISRRIAALVKALRWRGAYLDPAIGDFLSRFEDAEDGAILPVENPTAAQNGGLDKAFWFQPIEQLVATLVQLYQAREQTKQAIYEITGISDIVRGASMASETATAQQIKAQWGSLRVQKLQRDVQRFARDLLRMMAEIIAEKFQPATIFSMAAIQLPTQNDVAMAAQQGRPAPNGGVTQEVVIQFLRDQALRDYRVDIETDSTIRADLTGQQQNISQFVQGFGAFVQSIGPAVQGGFMPMDKASALLKSFAQVFKLGRDAEEAIEALGEQQAPPQADPAAAAQAQAQAEAQAEQAKLQAQMQAKEMELAAQREIEALKVQNAQEIERIKQEAETEREMMRLQTESVRSARAMELEDQRDRMRIDGEAKARSAPAVGLTLGEGAEAMFAEAQTVAAQSQERGAAAMETAAQAMAEAVAAMRDMATSAQRPRRIVRGADGRAERVEFD
jgi:hypothetical protein